MAGVAVEGRREGMAARRQLKVSMGGSSQLPAPDQAGLGDIRQYNV